MFKRNFALPQKRQTGRHPYERVPTPYQMFPLIGPQQEHNIDTVRAEDAFSSNLVYEEHIPGQTRDLSEEFQTIRASIRGAMMSLMEM